MTGGAITANAIMIKVRCGIKRVIGVTDITILLSRDMRVRSIGLAGGKARVMAAGATAGNSVMGCRQEDRRRKTTRNCAVMTDTAILYGWNVIDSFTQRNTSIMAQGAIVVIYAQVVEAGAYKAGKAAGMTVRAIPGRWQMIVGHALAYYTVVTGRAVDVNAAMTEGCVGEIRRGMADGTLLGGRQMI